MKTTWGAEGVRKANYQIFKTIKLKHKLPNVIPNKLNLPVKKRMEQPNKSKVISETAAIFITFL